ncbi:2'-deoxycytidine 5'-triphosphate deaminase domain-containing protein [Gemmatimonadota bacterium]
MAQPWDKWIPGVLSRRQVWKLHEEGLLHGIESRESIDHSSLDLHLTDEGYRLKGGSVKPCGGGFLRSLVDQDLAERIFPDSDQVFELQPKRTYLFRLRESLGALGDTAIYGRATAKSSIGRVDVLARLIVDGAKTYERFDPQDLTSNLTEMYLEVTPITFPVAVRPGVKLTQLRFFYGIPEYSEMAGPEVKKTCFSDPDKTDSDLSVDLEPILIREVPTVGFRAKSNEVHKPVRLWGQGHTDPKPYWELEPSDEHRRLAITEDEFYILRSRERLRVPPGLAVYARASDEEIGEMRIHYAGFAHPYFGWKRDDGKVGTPLIFEVRGHSVNVSLLHGEVLARLRFFRMSQRAKLEDFDDNNYNEQELQLSKFFKAWDC